MKMHKRFIFLGGLALFFLPFVGFAQSSIKQNPLIPELLVLKAKMTESNELGERYKIQLFYGETLEAANKVKEQFEREHAKWPSSIEYEAPNYKVWVGDFRNKLEAERAYIVLKKDFKSAFIFRP